MLFNYGKNQDTLKIHLPVSILAETTNHLDWLDIDLSTKTYYKRYRIVYWQTNEIAREGQKKYNLTEQQVNRIQNLLNDIDSYREMKNGSIYRVEYNNNEYHLNKEILTNIFKDDVLAPKSL